MPPVQNATQPARNLATTTKSSQNQFLVRVAGISEYFSRKTGGRRTAQVTKARDGGKLEPEVFTGFGETEDVTVSRLYDAARDAPLIARLYPLVGRWRGSISITPTDANLVPIAKATVYHGVLNGCTPPEVDADSSEPARFELTFGIGAVR